MEGVGARLGRSSSRYGTTTVFNGPVRKWKKDWIPINPPSSSSSSSSSNNSHHHHHHGSSSNGSLVVNGGGNSGNSSSSVSHLRLFKWTPLKENNTNNNNSNNNLKDSNKINSNKSSDNDVVSEEDVPKRKKFKYIPIALLEEQKKETEENSDDEAKPTESDEEQPSKSDEKPDINDVPMEDNQPDEDNRSAPARQDLNELDLSLGLSHEEDDSTPDPK